MAAGNHGHLCGGRRGGRVEPIDKLANGEFRGGPQVFDLAAGGVDYSTSGGFVDDISAELDDYKQQIIDGEIEVPTAP